MTSDNIGFAGQYLLISLGCGYIFLKSVKKARTEAKHNNSTALLWFILAVLSLIGLVGAIFYAYFVLIFTVPF